MSGFDAGDENIHYFTHHATRNAACHSVTAKPHMPRRGRTGGRRNTKSAVPSKVFQLQSTPINSHPKCFGKETQDLHQLDEKIKVQCR